MLLQHGLQGGGTALLHAHSKKVRQPAIHTLLLLEGSGAAAFAFVCQLFVLFLTMAAGVLSLKSKSIPCVVHLLSTCFVLVLFSFCYFGELNVMAYTYKPGITWGWVFNILAVFVYVPAIVLALAAAGDGSTLPTTQPSSSSSTSSFPA